MTDTTLKTVQALADEIARAAFDEGVAHGKGAKNFCGSNGKVFALIDALIAQMQREAVQPPVAWMHEFTDPHTGERNWTTHRRKPYDYELLPGDIIRPLVYADAAPHPEAQALDSQLQQPDGHSTRASGVCATTMPAPETTGTRLTGSVAVAINGMQFEPPWFLECVRGASYHIDRKAAQVDAYDLPPKSIPRDEFTGEQLRAAYEVCTASVRTTKREDGAGISPATPADANMGCACRWVGTEYVERCDFHDAWHTALHEWADRARTAEALLRELRSCSHHDPYAKKSWTNSQGRWVTANVPADLWGRIEAVASTGADTARHGQDDHAGSPAPSEPVAVVGSDFQLLWCRKDWSKGLRVGAKLYTHPAPSESSKAALSDDDIHRIWMETPERPTLAEEVLAFGHTLLARAGITRKPLTETEVADIVREASRGAATRRDGTTSTRIVRAVERFHGITPQAGKESGDAS